MEALLVNGPAYIKGELSIGRAKNSALAILPAALMKSIIYLIGLAVVIYVILKFLNVI